MNDPAFMATIICADLAEREWRPPMRWPDPDGEDARLIYADLLQEQGDHYGDFIRLQCELEAGKKFNGGMGYGDLPYLRMKQVAMFRSLDPPLFSAQGWELRLGDEPNLRGPAAFVRRGFVWKVRCSWHLLVKLVEFGTLWHPEIDRRCSPQAQPISVIELTTRPQGGVYAYPGVEVEFWTPPPDPIA